MAVVVAAVALIAAAQPVPSGEGREVSPLTGGPGGAAGTDAVSEEFDESTKGFLEPVRRTVVGAPTHGRIVKMLIEEGDQVNEGDVLVQLDDRRRWLEHQLTKFDAENTTEVDHARVNAEYRKAEYQRQYQYYHSSETPMISESDLKSYLLQSDLARAVLDLREAELARRQRLVKIAAYDLENTSIRAPFTGVVTRKVAEVGLVAELGTPLLELIDVHQLYFVLKTFPTSRLREVAVGQEVLVTPDVFPEYRRRGRVVLIGPEAYQPSQTVRVKVLVENADGKLRAGLSARATFLPLAEPAATESRAAAARGVRK